MPTLSNVKWHLVRKGVIFLKPLKSKVSITLDEDIVTKIKKPAEQDDRSFSQYINLILREHLNKKDLDVES